MVQSVYSWAISWFIHVVASNPEEHISERREADARLDLIGWLVIARAGLIGLISGLVVVGVAFFLEGHHLASGLSSLEVFLVMTLVSALATGFELVFIYRDSLQTAARMASILGIPKEDLETVGLEHSIPHWLIHAALGAPGFKGTMFGIDPLEHIGKAGHFIRKILSKLRVLASATMFKIIVRRLWARLMGRVAARAIAMLVALPFFVFFNMVGTRSMIRDMRSRLVGHELMPKLIVHAFPEGLDGISNAMHCELRRGLSEQIQTARFIHPNQIRFLNTLPKKNDDHVESDATTRRRAQRFLLALFFMSGQFTPRCRKLVRKIEAELGEEEAELIHQEIDDAIHDLTPLERPWV